MVDSLDATGLEDHRCETRCASTTDEETAQY